MVGDCEREDERQERIRVLLVGEPEAVPELDPLGEDEEMLTVGRVVGAEEVAPAVDSLQPHVLVLGSTLLQMAFRMATCPSSSSRTRPKTRGSDRPTGRGRAS
jgi:hypothetical protein